MSWAPWAVKGCRAKSSLGPGLPLILSGGLELRRYGHPHVLLHGETREIIYDFSISHRYTILVESPLSHSLHPQLHLTYITDDSFSGFTHPSKFTHQPFTVQAPPC